MTEPGPRLFSELAAAAPAVERIEGEARIEALAYDSRRVRPGTLFIATGGVGHDALAYLGDALERGASAVVAPVGAPRGVTTAWGVSESPRLALAQLARAWWGSLDRGLRLIGVTGTNGKTTCVHLIRAALAAAGRRTALLGTTGYYLGEEWEEAPWTTPEPLKLHELLHRAAADGLQDVVLEVTSHALDQERVAGLEFAAAGFTNLTPEHLDYHRRMEGYFATKSRLFTRLSPGAPALLNADDDWARRVVVPEGRRILYGYADDADLRPVDVRLTRRRLELGVADGDSVLELGAPLIGEYDVYNVLLCVGVCRGLGVPDEAIRSGLAGLRQIPGRFQLLEVEAPFEVIVDFAHTPDALTKSLTAARRLARGRVIVVFGSAGERDAVKRPAMGRAAAELADVVILTADDPRREDPAEIAAQIASGIPEGSCELMIEVDRRRAVFMALETAREGDVVVAAGKGHETVIKYADHQIPSNDIDLCHEFFRSRRGR